MLCYLTRMESYYIKCIKDGPFQLKIAKGAIKPEIQWTLNERMVVIQDQRLKSIIMSCIPDNIIESVISCETAKAKWADLVHSFKGPLDTKENMIMDLKLEYQTFRANPSESLSQTYTRYKTMFNDLANDGVNLSKHEINVDIYERFVYEDNLIQRMYFDTKKALITTPSSTVISTTLFSNNVIQDFQENSNDEKDYKAEYKKMKAKLALFEASPSTYQTPKTFYPMNKGLVAETFDQDEEEVSDDEEVIEVKVLMALADDELTVGKNHARNGEWIDITMRKVNILLSMDEDVDWKINLNHEMVPKSKYWVERLNPDSKLPNFNTGRILVPKSQAVNEFLKPTEASTDPESSKDSKAESLTPLPPLKILSGASPSSEVMLLIFQPHSPKERLGLGIMKHTKPETQDSLNKSVSGTNTVSETKPTTPLVPTEVKNIEQEYKINELTKLVQMLIDEKVNSTQKTQESKSQIQQTESSKSVDPLKISYPKV
ncbi:hypothetical protein Tco_0678105 [Tanacetum coccineum]|uniref:Retrovirus-related Pol polyprotein from transposon TNT 1-94 n=1 Tax=Tanacetum coccineum TaxID=301880 RepID=A0ABQ4XFF7_9ASTR